MSRAAWLLGGLIVAVAAWLRFTQLDARPMHADEAVHAVKFFELWESGRYVYDPHDYHGPSLYFLTLPIAWLTGATTLSQATEATFRFVPALFGVMCVLLAMALRRFMGAGAWWSTAFLAVSPAMVYYSRYCIHEMLLVTFTLAFFAAMCAWWTRPTLWRAILAGLCLGLMQATKETWIVNLAALLAAIAIVRLVQRRRALDPPDASAVPASNGVRPLARHVLIAAVASLCVSLTLYSSLFQRPQGILDALRALPGVVTRATADSDHVNGPSLYLAMYGTICSNGMVLTELPVVLLAIVGGVEVWRTRSGGVGPARILLIYAIMLAAVTFAARYKTPWLMIQFHAPLLILAGLCAAELTRRAGLRGIAAAACIVALACVWPAWQAHAASVTYSSAACSPYLYAATSPRLADAVRHLQRLASAHPERMKMRIAVIAENPWPLPWALRSFERVGYWEQPPGEVSVDVVLSDRPLATDALASFGAHHHSHYALRTGVVLYVYVHERTFAAYVRRAGADASMNRGAAGDDHQRDASDAVGGSPASRPSENVP